VPADLEIGLYRWEAGKYTVDLRFDQPGQNATPRQQSAPFPIAFSNLRALENSPREYGKALWAALFGDPRILTGYAGARAAVLTGGGANPPPANGEPPLRVRLYISPNAPELHALRWETLAEPDGRWVATDQRVPFSRYGLSADWRPVRPPPAVPGKMSVVLVIANPAGLENYKPGGVPLPPVKVEEEAERARRGLAGADGKGIDPAGVTEYSERAAPGPDGRHRRATLDNLLTALRTGCDLLYVVAHGALNARGDPQLWLEDERGEADVVSGSDLLARLRDLAELPRLVVLASCRSAGVGTESRAGDGGALAALGPRLVEAGVPAVLAMQGDVFMDTVAAFMPTFFAELIRTGSIDQAAAAARGAARGADRPDWWAPVLYHRIKDGQLWGQYGQLVGPPHDRFPWTGLIQKLSYGRCTAILGSGMLDHLLGPTRQAAVRLSELHRFPLSPADRDDLPQVAQYLNVLQDRDFPRYEWAEYLKRHLRHTFSTADALPDKAGVDDLIVAAAGQLQATDPTEAHTLLATLPFPLYVTTNADSVLYRSLKKQGKKPRVGVFAPGRRADDIPRRVRRAAGEDAEDRRPVDDLTETEPMVYYLYGHWVIPETPVLSEDDYFDFLLQVHAAGDKIPRFVEDRLVDTTLVFLGFRLEEWDFRVLIRSINALEGSPKLKSHVAVAVQIDPASSRFVDPASAREFLEKSIQLGKGTSVYWGKTEDFLKELSNRYHNMGV
jgi:hypothetical protein